MGATGEIGGSALEVQLAPKTLRAFQKGFTICDLQNWRTAWDSNPAPLNKINKSGGANGTPNLRNCAKTYNFTLYCMLDRHELAPARKDASRLRKESFPAQNHDLSG
jgi:hypothetical protein